MLDNDIIERVSGPTPWVSPIVPIVKENGDIRICTDAKQLNTAIEREVHNSPTVDDIAIELNEAKYISKFDLCSGYNQLELDKNSRDITVFATHDGLFRYKRLNFGIKSAAEIFQKAIESVIQDIPNCRNISDDIIVFGKTVEEHDKTLHLVLKRLEESGLTLNVEKCSFRQTELDFFGLHFSPHGIRLKQSKIDALKNAGAPKDAKQLKSLYGLLSYASKFIPNAATLMSPFRDLLKRKAKFIWTKEHNEALAKMKEALTNEAMAFFNKDWITELTTDAIPTGLGAELSQIDPSDHTRRQIVLYASRSLSPIERKYSQVEREALAIVWACERLKLYLIGKQFNLVVDNKAVELIYKNPKSKPSARLDRWGLRLIPYSFNIRYEPGHSNIADFISRNTTEEVKVGEDYVENYVNMLVDCDVPVAIKLENMKQATNQDETLQEVKSMIRGEIVEL